MKYIFSSFFTVFASQIKKQVCKLELVRCGRGYACYRDSALSPLLQSRAMSLPRKKGGENGFIFLLFVIVDNFERTRFLLLSFDQTILYICNQKRVKTAKFLNPKTRLVTFGCSSYSRYIQMILKLPKRPKPKSLHMLSPSRIQMQAGNILSHRVLNI